MLALPKPPVQHLMFGSGGSKAGLLGSGSIVALAYAMNRENLLTIGAASGGTINASMFAAGLSHQEIVGLNYECDFAKLLPETGSRWDLLKDLLRREFRLEDSIHEGLMDTQPLGEAVEKHVKSWPKQLWITATCRDAVT